MESIVATNCLLAAARIARAGDGAARRCGPGGILGDGDGAHDQRHSIAVAFRRARLGMA